MLRNPKTSWVLSYWLGLKGPRVAPWRRDVAPRDLKSVLPYLFIAECVDYGETIFRLAGTGLCERYGRELRDQNLVEMWPSRQQPAINTLIEQVIVRPVPGVLAFRAETADQRSISCEMLLLPLMTDDRRITRLMGSIFASEHASWLGERPLEHQWLVSAQLLGDDDILEPLALPTERGHGGPRPYLQLVVSQDQPGM